MAHRLGRHAENRADVGVAEPGFEEVAAGVLAQAMIGVERLAVRIDVAEVNDGLEIRVSDDGPGCSPDDRERMAERGVRLDETVPGHGLGLAICREITDFYQGQLRFETDPALGGLAVIATLRLPDDNA